MTKKVLTFGILLIILAGVFTPSVVFGASCTDAQKALGWKDVVNIGSTTCVPPSASPSGGITANNQVEISDVAGWLAAPFFKAVGLLLMTLSALILTISGHLFDWVVEFTIIKMAANINDQTGVGGSITLAWAALRDIANMCFIFVLLFAAFKTMFDSNFGNFNKTIINIIIIALLINFSLFFSKVVIDASNIVSVGFYKAITQNTASVSLGGQTQTYTGISAGFINMLRVQTFFSPEFLKNSKLDAIPILIIGVMSSIVMLISAVVLLIAGIMFATRFIILVFLMILSPLAFIAYAIPGQDGHFNKWKESLIDQSFFAPLYFALTWVVFKLGASLLIALDKFQIQQNGQVAQSTDWTNLINNPKSAMALLVNYVLIIGFSIAALIFAKSMASKTKYFGTISGGISTMAIGGAAWAGRSSFGQIGKAVSENAALQKAAKEKKGLVGAGARLALSASQKARSGTFDVRNATIPTNILGEAIEGTLGRTTYGKKLGLNDVNIPSVEMSSIVKDMDLLGKGGTKGYKETKEESSKRVREKEAAAASELAIAQAKKDIMEGAKDGVAPGTPAYEAMEKALAKISDKETETLVANNRELLDSLNFANTISVKQLEALNKSDQFSDDEKKRLKGMRFKAIDNAMAEPDPVTRIAKIDAVKGKIKALSDSELEMIDAKYIEDEDFAEQLKGSQVDAINKNNKFTTSQKDKFKEARLAPLLTAIRTGNTNLSQSIVRKADTKTKVGYMKPVGTPPVIIAMHPDILPIYTPKMLQRMALHDDMSDSDIHDLREALLGRGGTGAPGVLPATIAWLNDRDKGGIEFP